LNTVNSLSVEAALYKTQQENIILDIAAGSSQLLGLEGGIEDSQQ
jgi:hypothetical protein